MTIQDSAQALRGPAYVSMGDAQANEHCRNESFCQEAQNPLGKGYNQV